MLISFIVTTVITSIGLIVIGSAACRQLSICLSPPHSQIFLWLIPHRFMGPHLVHLNRNQAGENTKQERL